MKNIEEIVELIEKAYIAAITNTSIGKSSPISQKLHDLIVQFHPSKQRRIQQLQELNNVGASNITSFRRGNMATYTGAMVNPPPVVKKTKMEDFGKHRKGDKWNPPQPQDQPQGQNQSENVAEDDLIEEIATPSKRGRKSKSND